jgi:hypothetical protein
MFRNRAIMTVLGPFLVPTSYFPSHGSGSCSLHNFKKIFKLKFLSLRFSLKLYGSMLILTWNYLLCSHTLIPVKMNVSIPSLRPFYAQSRNPNLEQDPVSGSGSGSDPGKMIRFLRFRFRLQLCNTALFQKPIDISMIIH